MSALGRHARSGKPSGVICMQSAEFLAFTTLILSVTSILWSLWIWRKQARKEVGAQPLSGNVEYQEVLTPPRRPIVTLEFDRRSITLESKSLGGAND